MAFCLLPDESVEDGVKRIVSEEIDQAIKKIDSPRLKRTAAIHEVRKHCKKIRGLLRLVRPQFEKAYQFENVWFRDSKGVGRVAGRRRYHRDICGLLDKFNNQIDRRAFVSMRRVFPFAAGNCLKAPSGSMS